MKKIIAAALSLIAFSASAADKSWYVGADLGSSQFEALHESENKTGGGLTVGYALNKNVAFEATVRALGAWDFSGTPVTATALQVSVLGILPVSEQFAVYGRLGFGRNSFSASESKSNATVTASIHSNAALLGLGAEFSINKHFGVRAEYSHLGNNEFVSGATKLKISQFNMGLNYAF